VVKRLLTLDEVCEEWKEGPFPDFSYKVTPESESTLKNPKFAKMRTFLCPPDDERLFSLHIRVTPGEWRIYFIADCPGKPVYVGYIGPHLPTTKFH